MPKIADVNDVQTHFEAETGKPRPLTHFDHGEKEDAPSGTNHPLSDQRRIKCPSQSSILTKGPRTYRPRFVGNQYVYQHKGEGLSGHGHPYLQGYFLSISNMGTLQGTENRSFQIRWIIATFEKPIG